MVRNEFVTEKAWSRSRCSTHEKHPERLHRTATHPPVEEVTRITFLRNHLSAEKDVLFWITPEERTNQNFLQVSL